MQILSAFYNYLTHSRKRTLLTIFIAHSTLIFIILLSLLILGKDYADFILRDDGYYRYAANFLRGEFSTNNLIGPVLPLIMAPIHIFPEFLHPIIRIIISQTFVYIILATLSKLTDGYLTTKQFFLG
jgi:hypothetical protein